MLKYTLLISMLFGASLAQICPPVEVMKPCTCSEAEKTIICDNVRGRFDVKGHFNNISSLFADDIIFNKLSISSNTGLFEIPAGTITDLKFLEIQISYNPNLENISPDTFNATHSVTKELAMWDNSFLIHGWPYNERDIFEFFNKFTEVETIWVPGCRITEVPENAFGPLPKLQELYLGSNDLAKIGSNAFSQLPNLTKMWTAYSSLTVQNISVDAFVGISNQLDIELDNNDIDHLPEQTFKPLLDNALKITVGGSRCGHTGCSYKYLTCDERADWICANQAVYEPKLIGFRCEGFVDTEVWSYCANLTMSSL